MVPEQIPIPMPGGLAIELPRFIAVRQRFNTDNVADVDAAVAESFAKLPSTELAGRSVAVAVGSRGIRPQPPVVRAVIRELKAAGAEPFVIPAMGSHGGGIAEGQRLILHMLHYHDELLRDFGANPKRKTGFFAPLKELIGPYVPSDYASIVSGDWNVCEGSPGSGLAGVKSGRYQLGEALPKEAGTVTGVNVQYHPRDYGTLAEIQENWPGQTEFPRNKGTYYPAGNTWQNDVDTRPHGGVTTGFAAVEIAPREGSPEEICDNWVNGLRNGCERDPDQPATLRLAGGQSMRFVAPVDGRTGVVGVDLFAVPDALRRFTSIDVCGVTWRLVDPAPAA